MVVTSTREAILKLRAVQHDNSVTLSSCCWTFAKYELLSSCKSPNSSYSVTESTSDDSSAFAEEDAKLGKLSYISKIASARYAGLTAGKL